MFCERKLPHYNHPVTTEKENAPSRHLSLLQASKLTVQHPYLQPVAEEAACHWEEEIYTTGETGERLLGHHSADKGGDIQVRTLKS